MYSAYSQVRLINLLINFTSQTSL